MVSESLISPLPPPLLGTEEADSLLGAIGVCKRSISPITGDSSPRLALLAATEKGRWLSPQFTSLPQGRILIHQGNEGIEDPLGVVGPRRGFRVVLDGKNRLGSMAEPRQ
jgi:hypothetical protein